MKNLKYRHDNRVQKKIMKERITALNSNQRRNHKMNSIMLRSAMVLYLIMMVSFFILSGNIIDLYIVNDVLSIMLMVILILLSLIMPMLILFPFINYVIKKYPINGLPRIIREMRVKGNSDYFKYYKISDDYIITKIYDSSNPVLVNKDCMIYFYNNKLRITNDFTTSSYDFGCYEFDFEEFELSYDRSTDLLKTVMLTNKLSLVLGKRAKPYILRKVSETT